MANKVYPNIMKEWIGGNVDWDADPLKVALVRGYSYNGSHTTLSDVTGAGGTIVATDTLSGKTRVSNSTSAVADANDDNLGSVAAGAACSALVIYEDTGSPATSKLWLFIDTASGLPVTPDGSPITITWDNGANKIFSVT